jgi:dienelactone hydrolase
MAVGLTIAGMPFVLILLLFAVPVMAVDKVTPVDVVKHLQRVYDPDLRKLGFRADYPGGTEQWRKDWRPVLHRLVGLERIETLNREHRPSLRFGKELDFGEFTRQKGEIETEPYVRIPFWMFRPKGKGPFPLAILPHGHDSIGHDTYAGVFKDEKHKLKILAQDRDVAVQAVKRGFVAIAPAVRGLAVNGVPDVYRRHGGRACRSHLMHCLLAGRTAIGERVWDTQRIIDWAVQQPGVDGTQILMMGNSGGGFVTMYAAALDRRITIAVPSCSFDKLVAEDGRIYQCDCNTVPGVLEYGGMSDVVGLIAPRHLLLVNGHGDSLHNDADIRAESAEVAKVFNAAGVRDHFDHRWGNDGHRFYKDLMWPFVMNALK